MAPPEHTSDKRLSWPSLRLTCSGRFTHIVVTRRLQADHRTYESKIVLRYKLFVSQIVTTILYTPHLSHLFKRQLFIRQCNIICYAKEVLFCSPTRVCLPVCLSVCPHKNWKLLFSHWCHLVWVCVMVKLRSFILNFCDIKISFFYILVTIYFDLWACEKYRIVTQQTLRGRVHSCQTGGGRARHSSHNLFSRCFCVSV